MVFDSGQHLVSILIGCVVKPNETRRTAKDPITQAVPRLSGDEMKRDETQRSWDHIIPNQGVAGSSPAGVANIQQGFHRAAGARALVAPWQLGARKNAEANGPGVVALHATR
jgi:hypothetical protein